MTNKLVLSIMMGLMAATTTAQESHSRLRFLPPPAVEGVKPPKRNWFSQLTDHFNSSNRNTWRQKYYYSGQFYKPGGPIFLYVGGEFELLSWAISGGHFVEMAEQNNAFLFGLEHRYYGQSFPVGIEHISDSFELLSVDQALADLAHFVANVVKRQQFAHLAGARWIAMGCSYPGTLAAWLRGKYPHLVHAAIASSAPMIAQTEFPDYEDVVARVLNNTKPGCLENVKEASYHVKEIQEAENTTYLEKMFPDATGDVVIQVNDMISSLVQANYEFFDTVRPVELLCSMMTNETIGSITERYATIWKRFKKRYFDEALNDLVYVAWRYQTCTELGYQFVTRNDSTYPFHVKSLEETISNDCSIFGPGFDKERIDNGVKMMNEKYGAKLPNVSRVVFTNGADDPWSPLGITSQVPKGDNYVIVIPGEPHCVDFLPSRKEDSPALHKAREQIRKIVRKWVMMDNTHNTTSAKPIKQGVESKNSEEPLPDVDTPV